MGGFGFLGWHFEVGKGAVVVEGGGGYGRYIAACTAKDRNVLTVEGVFKPALS